MTNTFSSLSREVKQVEGSQEWQNCGIRGASREAQSIGGAALDGESRGAGQHDTE